MSKTLVVRKFSQVPTMNNLKLVCMFNGILKQCSQSGELRYVDGEECVGCVDRSIRFCELISMVMELDHCSSRGKNSPSSFVLFYGVEQAGNCLLAPVTCDNDVKCMVDKYFRILETLGVEPRVWIFVCYNDNSVKYNERSDAFDGHLVGRYYPMRLGYGADVNGGMRCLKFAVNEPDKLQEYLDNCRNYGGTVTNHKLSRSMVGRIEVRTGLDVSKRGLTIRPKKFNSWMVPSSSGIEKDMEPVTSSDHGLNNRSCVGVVSCGTLDGINYTSSEGQMSHKNGLGSECPEETYVDLPMHSLSISSFDVAADDFSDHNARTETEHIKIKKHVKINGELPSDLAKFNTYLATKDLQTINSSDIKCIKELGSGAYSTIFYGKCQGSDVVIKKLRLTRDIKDTIDETLLVADFWKEAHILSHLHHPNVVALYGVVRDGHVSNYATVTEYMVDGSLKQVLMREYRTIDDRKKIIIAMNAACGMEYLHENNLTHFNLKSHNLLVNMTDPLRPVCKIGDLGLSRIKQQILLCGGVQGALPWIAPELLNRKENVNEKVDVYSFGVVMWELLTGKEPYGTIRPETMIGGILKGKLRPEIPCWCNPQWRALMEKCWSSVPDARPSFSQIVMELRTMAASMNIKKNSAPP